MQSSGSIISLHIGQAGIQAGNSVWQVFSLEHTLNPQETPIISDQNINTNFSQDHGDNLQSRAVFVDLEPTAINQLKTGFSRTLHRTQNLISGKSNVASNYATGYYTAGKELLEQIMDKVRKEAERCSQLQGFMVYRSLGGGTGSGLGSLIAQNLSVSYGKKTKVGMNIYPSIQSSQSCIWPYNSLLATHANLQHLDVSMIFDNQAIYDICRRNLDIQKPKFLHMNSLIAQATSSITTGIRFNGSINGKLSQFTTNLVPFPRINSILLSYSPIVQPSQGYSFKMSVAQLTPQVLQPANILAKCDPALGKYIAMTLNYRGDVRSKDISATISTLKTKKSICFVDWAPTSFKLGIERSPPVYLPRSKMAALPKSCCAIFNNTVVSHLYGRLAHKFDLLHSKQASLHSYINQGMEASKFLEARQDIEALLVDYQQIQIQPLELMEG